MKMCYSASKELDMPVIKLTVPSDVSDRVCREAEEKIVEALRNEGVQGGISLWPLLLARVPDRQIGRAHV